MPKRVHVIREGHGQRRQSASATLHTRLPAAVFDTRKGLRMLKPAFALLGVAAHHGIKQRVVLLDAGLPEGMVADQDVTRMLAACTCRQGHAVAAAAAALADSASESPADATGAVIHHALVREKPCEDRLRALGFEVVRLVWADLKRPEHVRSLIEAALTRATPRS